jgi:hypothetical protein
MKRLLFLFLPFPYLSHCQPTLWNEFTINKLLPQFATPGINSLFQPNLSKEQGSEPKLNLLLCTGNRYSMKETSYLDAGVILHMKQGAIGYKGQFHGLGKLNSNSHQIHYTQMISSTLLGGLSIGIVNKNFTGEATDIMGSVQLKIRQNLGERTSVGFGLGVAGNPIRKQDQMIKHWSCQWDQLLNPVLSMGAAVEKIDGLEPSMRLFMQAQIRRGFSLAAGWDLDNGNVEMTGLYYHKSTVKGLLISHHPLLGYGLELMLQYGIQ